MRPVTIRFHHNTFFSLGHSANMRCSQLFEDWTPYSDIHECGIFWTFGILRPHPCGPWCMLCTSYLFESQSDANTHTYGTRWASIHRQVSCHLCNVSGTNSVTPNRYLRRDPRSYLVLASCQLTIKSFVSRSAAAPRLTSPHNAETGPNRLPTMS